MNIKQLIKNESGFQCFQAELMILIIVVGIGAAIAIPQFAAYRRRSYDSDVKANLKNAAKAEETYYKDNGKYTAKIDRLTGFNQGDNVTITVEATKTSYTIAGKVTYGCEAKTGVWFIDSTTGDINGTPCR